MLKVAFAGSALYIAFAGIHCARQPVSSLVPNSKNLAASERDVLLALLRDKRPNDVVIKSAVFFRICRTTPLRLLKCGYRESPQSDPLPLEGDALRIV